MVPPRFSAEMLIPHEEMLGITTTPYTEEEIQLTSYRPTIIIGLGGTGYDVVRKLKRRIEAHFGSERSQAFQYLVIDTAPENPPASEVPLGPSIFTQLKGFPAGELIDNLKKGEPIERWWVKPHRPAFAGVGAGAIRAVGRLVLFRYANTIIQPRLYNKIRDAVNIVNQQGYGNRGVKIYVVCSLAGGTGSGTFLDIAYMARSEALNLFPNECFVTGVLVMPSAFTARAKAPIERQRWQANGYAALRELDLQNFKKDFYQDYGGGYKVGRAVKGQKPFNIAYLISLFNENGLALSGYESLTEMISEEMMLEIASPMQGEVSNLLDNIHQTDTVRENHPFAYSSFAVSSLIYPLRGMASWCGLNFELAFINDILLNPLHTAEDAGGEVNGAIDRFQLREEGADQVIGALDKDKLGRALPTGELEYATFEGAPDNLLLTTFQTEMHGCQDLLDQAKREIFDRRGELQLNMPPQLRSWINSIIKDPERGPAYAEIILMSLEAKLKAYKSEHMLKEQEEFSQQQASAQVDLETAQSDLEKAVGLPSISPVRRGRIKRAVNDCIGAFNSRIIAEHQAVLREHAGLYFSELLEKTGILLRQVRELISELKKEAQEAKNSAEKAWVHLKVTQSDFSLVHSIVDETVLTGTYEEQKPVYTTPDEKRALTSDFWAFVKRRVPNWELGKDELIDEGFRSLPFYFLGELIGQKLASVPLLERMKKVSPVTHDRRREIWREQIGEAYTGAAPFWNTAIVKNVHEIDRNVIRNPNLVGYGENNLEIHWSDDINSSLAEQITPVQTKNNQELVFLKTVHGLPLFAVHEAEKQLRETYELLEEEWKKKGSDLPVHCSRIWEEEVTRRDRDLVKINPEKDEEMPSPGNSKKKAPVNKENASSKKSPTGK